MIWLFSFAKTITLALVGAACLRLCLWVPILFPPILILAIAYTYQTRDWLQGKMKKQQVSLSRLRWVNCREGINGLTVFLVSLIVAFTISATLTTITGGITFAVIGELLSKEGARLLGYQLGRSSANVFAFVWFAAATCLYRYEAWAQRQRSLQKATKTERLRAKAQPTQPMPVDPTDLELDRMRGGMGLTQMKRNRPKPRSKT